MGTSALCPYCGATSKATGEPQVDPMRQAVDALYWEVAHIRRLAETSADQSGEVRMLQETVARLRGRSVAAVQYAAPGNGQPAANGQYPANGQRGARPAHRPASASGHGSRSTSAA